MLHELSIITPVSGWVFFREHTVTKMTNSAQEHSGLKSKITQEFY